MARNPRYPRIPGSPAAKAQGRAAFAASGGFVAVAGAALSTAIDSNLITLANIGTGVALTITGGSYSKNGGAFATAPTTVSDGDTLRLRVTSSASEGTITTVTATIGGAARSFSVTTAAAQAAAPVNTGLPAITGIAQEGQILSVSNGTWSNSPTGYTYQWNRGGTAITGSINATRTLTAADIGAVMTCTVTAINATGSTPATSVGTTAVIAATVAVPVNSVAPAVTGTGTVGQTLTTDNGTWSNSPSGYTYQWRRDGVDITGATSQTYMLVSADGGHSITCRVIATNAGGSAGSTSNAIVVAAAGAALTSNKRVLIIGDSLPAGVGADPTGATSINGARPFSWPLQMMNRLNALGIKAIADTIAAENNNGYSQAEWNGYRPEITVVGALATGSLTTTAGGAAYRLGAGVSIALDTATAVDTVEVGVPRASGFGVLNINDGTNNYTVSETNATADYIRVVVPLTSGKSIKKLTFSIASGAVHGPFYVNAYDSTTPSVQIINAGARNWRSTEWIVADNPSRPLNAITTIQPHVAMIALGTNEARQAGTSIAQFKTNMQVIIQRCKDVGAIVILVVPTPIQTYNTTTDAWSQAAMKTAYDELLAANPGSYLVDSPTAIAAAGLSGATNPATWAALSANGYAYDNLHMKAPPYQPQGYKAADVFKLALGL